MSTPVSPQASVTRLILFALLLMGTALLIAVWSYGFRAHLRALTGARIGGYSPVTDFALRDSLPTLEGGLSNLEAFRSAISPVWRADAERSVWLADSLGSLTLEFVTQKTAYDSVTLFAWTTGTSLRTRVFRARNDGREARWTLTPARLSARWTEVVAAYVSDPPFLSFQSGDSATRLFARAEGRVFHVVGGWYFNRREKRLWPDTAYPLDSRNMTKGNGELSLLARGQALAVVNPGSRPVTLRLLESGTTRSEILHADSAGVSVYRTLLRERTGALLAYTEPGLTFPVFRTRTAPPQEFFVLRP